MPRSVFPTCVGVFPVSLLHQWRDLGLPHMRGGVSARCHPAKPHVASSPHAWGCFLTVPKSDVAASVFPTCVGVFLNSHLIRRRGGGLPHMRGGVSAIDTMMTYKAGSSPHAWGCFRSHSSRTRRHCVFPTCVGVFLAKAPVLPIQACLPHMRGGVSFC